MARAILVAALLSLVLVFSVSQAQDEDPELTQEEVTLGRDASNRFEKMYRIVSSGPKASRLQTILKRIAAVSGRTDLPYKVKLVNDPTVNALTFPGGFIYVFKGLLDQDGMDDHMLACIIGHEVAHACRSHGYRKVLSMEILGQLSGGRDSAAVQMGQLLTVTGVGRRYEYEADRMGLQYAHKAGYDARGMRRVMQLFKRLGDETPGAISGLLSTHPPASDRLKRIDVELKKLGRR